MKPSKRPRLTTDDLLRNQERKHPHKPLKRSRDESNSEASSSHSEDDRGADLEPDLELESASGFNAAPRYDSSQSEGEEPEEREEDGDLTSLESKTISRFKTLAPVKTSINAPKAGPCSSRSFVDLGVVPSLIETLGSLSIRKPTPVQVACIPPMLQGRDCVGNAKTGSGKTLAFGIPIIQQLSVDPYGIFALVLTPTRELAFQIAEQFSVVGAPLSIQTAVIVGGMDMMAQSFELIGRPHVVIATPGRLVDHMKSSAGEWDLSRVKFLILDEADRLLAPDFAASLGYIVDALPKERQTCLFTATLTPSIESIIETPPRPGKQKPFVHRMTDAVETVDTLEQYLIFVPPHVREAYLYYLLNNPPASIIHLRRPLPESILQSRRHKLKMVQHKKSKSSKQDKEEKQEQPPPTIIFCTRTRTAAYLKILLNNLGIRSTALHSRQTQKERLSALAMFKSYYMPVLICTDLGARGLDIEGVAMVVNWDLADEPEEYTHRVGRTARMGRSGVALSFVSEEDEKRVLNIEKRISLKLDEMTLSQDKVLEHLNAVSTAKRIANMRLHDMKFGEKQEVYRKIDAKKKRQKSSR